MRTDIRQDLKDICVELDDVGIHPRYTFTGHGNILIKKEHNEYMIDTTFCYDEVSDVIDRIKDFMSMRGYKTEIVKTYQNTNMLNRIVNKLNGNVQRVRINFLNIEIDKFFDEIISGK